MRLQRGYVATALIGGTLAAGLAFVMLACSDRGDGPSPAEQAPPLFRDVTADTGIDFTYRNGEDAGHYAILESLGGGVALLDYDGDGLLDIFVTGGGYFDGPDHKAIKGHPCRLFKNLGGWKFKDVTDAVLAGQAVFYTHGCAVADYDRDGWPDLLVTGWGRVALYHNEPVDPADAAKGRKLVEVTARAGLGDKLWSTSAAWGDLDGDGYPDLYICHYVDWSFANHPTCPGYTSDVTRDVCPPLRFKGLPHILYRNNGDGTFKDVSGTVKLRRGDDGSDAGKGLGVVMADLNGDFRPEIYVANDTVAKWLYVNRGAWRFDEKALDAGVALDERGVAQGSMGIDIADYDGSGLAAIFVTNYENEMHALYRNLGNTEQFEFSTAAAGISAIGQRFVGFGTRFIDADNDGWWDIVIANGHVIRHPRFAGLAQRPILFHNQGKGKFRDLSARGGSYFQATHRGRGLAVGDLDNDGRADVVISHLNEPIAIVRNVAGEEGPRNHWLGITLLRKDRRDAVGSRVTVELAGRKLRWFVRGGGSYLSACDPRLLFGLGNTDKIDRVIAEWSHGGRQEWSGSTLAADRYWELREGEEQPRPVGAAR